MKNYLLILILSISYLGCATTPLPQIQREIVYIENTTANKKDAYAAALTYLAKNLGDSNFSIKMKDPEAGTIVTQIAFDCPELKTFMDISRHTPVFNLEVGAKDNRIRFVFEAVSDRIFNIDGSLITDRSFSTPAQINSIKPCVDREKAAIMTSLSKRGDW